MGHLFVRINLLSKAFSLPAFPIQGLTEVNLGSPEPLKRVHSLAAEETTNRAPYSLSVIIGIQGRGSRGFTNGKDGNSETTWKKSHEARG